MLTIPLDGTTLLIVVVVALTLLLAIFAPQTLANLLGEPITLFGRLLGTIADWLQKGAEKLFALVKSVFMIGKPVEKKASAETTAQAIPAAPAYATTSIQQQAGFGSNHLPTAACGSNGACGMSIQLPDATPYDQLAPYEPETSPSLTPIPTAMAARPTLDPIPARPRKMATGPIAILPIMGMAMAMATPRTERTGMARHREPCSPLRRTASPPTAPTMAFRRAGRPLL